MILVYVGTIVSVFEDTTQVLLASWARLASIPSRHLSVWRSFRNPNLPSLHPIVPLQGIYWGYMGIMEKKMETTI